MRLLLALICPLILFADAQTTREQLAAGRNLSSAKASELERSVGSKPNDIKARITLVGYYFAAEVRAGGDDEAVKARASHLRWIVENRPESDLLEMQPASLNGPDTPGYREAYDSVKAIWLHHLQAATLSERTLVNAVNYLGVSDRKIAEDALQAWLKIHPKSEPARFILGGLQGLSILGVNRTDVIGIPDWDSVPDLQSASAQAAYKTVLASTDSQYVCGAAGPLVIYGAPLLGRQPTDRNLIAMASAVISLGVKLNRSDQNCRNAAGRIVGWETIRKTGWLIEGPSEPDPVHIDILLAAPLLPPATWSPGAPEGVAKGVQAMAGETRAIAVIGTDGRVEQVNAVSGLPQLRSSLFLRTKSLACVPYIKKGKARRYIITF